MEQPCDNFVFDAVRKKAAHSGEGLDPGSVASSLGGAQQNLRYPSSSWSIHLILTRFRVHLVRAGSGFFRSSAVLEELRPHSGSLPSI